MSAAPPGEPPAAVTAVVARVLGPVEIAGPDGRFRPPRGTRAAALVAALALADGQAVAVPALVDRLWPDEAPADPRAALHNLVSRLRQGAAPDAVRSGPAGYALAGATDLGEARAAVVRAREGLAGGRPGDAAEAADAALALWRGEPGADLEDGAVAADLRREAARLHDELVAARREAAEAAGDHAAVVALASRALAADPLDEDAARALMTALAATGRPAEAVRVFGRLRHALVAELGADPAPDLVALHDRLLAEVTAAGVTATGKLATATPAAGTQAAETTPTPPAPTPPTRPAPPPPKPPVPPPPAAPPRVPPAPRRVALGLRAAPNALLGRDADVAAVAATLGRARLVTVLGAGGLGKTRLAQEVARRAAGDTPLVAVVELAGVRSDDDVVLALADALGLSAAGSTSLAERVLAGDLHDQLLARLRGAGALVVLDNCEHVATGAARWAAELLEQVPGLRILATSRAPLRVAAEQTYPLPPLAADGGTAPGPAVELFVQRARAARPDVRLPDEAVARLCERLDGLPLAIELAAARVRTMSVEEIEERLDARFALLRSGDAAAPDRHRTLEAVIEWSWNLVTPAQRSLWRRVAVLPDGFSADAAAAIGRLGGEAPPGRADVLDVLDDVEGLVTQSLLTVSDEDGVARYRMLETVREFGLLRLAEAGEREVVRDALLDWAGALTRRTVSQLLGPGQVAAVAALSRDQENLLFALRAAAERSGGRARRPEVVVRAFVGLAASWAMRGAEERAAGLVPAVLAALVGWPVPDEDADVTAVALVALAAASLMGPPGPARPLARLRRLLREREVGERTRVVASLALLPGRDAVTARLAELAGHPDPVLAFAAHLGAGQTAENDGRLAEALTQARAAYDRACEIGDVACPVFAAFFVASTATELADFATARAWTDRVRPGLAALGATGAARQLDWIGLAAALAEGDTVAAAALCDALEQPSDGPDDRGAVEARAVAGAGRAEICWARGDVDGALGHYADLMGSFEDGPSPAAPWSVMLGAAWLVRLVGAGRRDEAAAAAAWLGRRAVVMYREWMPEFLDRPVLGTACLAAGHHLLASGGDAGAGLELVALAEALGSRQDVVALRWGPLVDDAVARCGRDALDAARAAAAGLGADAVERALVLLERLPGQDERG